MSIFCYYFNWVGIFGKFPLETSLIGSLPIPVFFKLNKPYIHKHVFLFNSQRSRFYVLEVLDIIFMDYFLLMDAFVSVLVGMTMTLNPNGVGVKVEPVKGSASSSSKANKTLSA